MGYSVITLGFNVNDLEYNVIDLGFIQLLWDLM